VGEALTRRLAAVAGAAGALMIVGSALDWSGVEYSSQLDRWLAFAAGVLAAAAGVAALREPRLLVSCLAAGVLGLNMAIVNIRDIAGHEYEYAAYPEASVGIGLHALLVGSLLALAAGVSSLPALKRRRVAQ
jgi:peptidoglycan/LPS O-acetylase OafA/YrhL